MGKTVAYLAHHGVMGMKWGVWNAETQRKYGGGTTYGKKKTSEAGESRELKRLADTLAAGRGKKKNAIKYEAALRAILANEPKSLTKKRKAFTDLTAPEREAERLSQPDIDKYARKELARVYDSLYDNDARKKGRTKSQFINAYEKEKAHEWHEYAADGYIRERIGAKTDKDLWDHYAKVHYASLDYEKSCKSLVSKTLGVYGKRPVSDFSTGPEHEHLTLADSVVSSLVDDAYSHPERLVKDKR